MNHEAVAAYRKDGYFLAKGLFSGAEVAALRQEGHAIIDELAMQHDVRGTWETTTVSSDPDKAPTTELRHVHDLQLHSASFTRTLLDQRLAGSFATLMESANVQLHHNKLFIKVPERGSPFPLHQDWPFFPHADDTPMAAIVHLDDAPEEKGCVHVVPGSPALGRLDHVGSKQFYLPEEVARELDPVAVPAQAGDVLFFGYLMVHGSGINRSQESRTTWLVQVRNPSDLPTEERHQSPGQGTMLAGSNPDNPPPPSSL